MGQYSYDQLSMAQLYQLFVDNWKVMATGIQELLGEEEFPDPRRIAKELSEIPEDTWVGLFDSEGFRKESYKTLAIQKLMTQIQVENVQILEAALEKTEPEGYDPESTGA